MSFRLAGIRWQNRFGAINQAGGPHLSRARQGSLMAMRARQARHLTELTEHTRLCRAFLSLKRRGLEGALKAFDEYYGDASGKSVILEGSKSLCEIAERWMYDQR